MKTVEESLERADKTLRAVKAGLDQAARAKREQAAQVRDALDTARARGTISASEIADVESLLESLEEVPGTRPAARVMPRTNKSPNASWVRI